MPSPWLAVGDQFLLDGADWRVTAATIARADRMNFRLLQIEPALGGEERRLLQTRTPSMRLRRCAPMILARKGATSKDDAISEPARRCGHRARERGRAATL